MTTQTPDASPTRSPARCTLEVGCDETGVCYAVSQGQPDQCGRSPVVEAVRCSRCGNPDIRMCDCGLSGAPAVVEPGSAAADNKREAPETEDDEDPVCTGCGGTGICYQTERRCQCQPPITITHHNRHPWAQPGDEPNRWWILRFSDPDMREMLWNGPDAETEAREAYAKYCPAWSCYLFCAVQLVPSGDVAGLVEALRSPDHRQPIDPKAIYRTRDIKLFEEAADTIEHLSDLSPASGGKDTPCAKCGATECWFTGCPKAAPHPHVTELVEAITPENILSAKAAGDLTGWCERLRAAFQSQQEGKP